MSTEARNFASPPCPTCGAHVEAVAAEASEPYYSAEFLNLAGYGKRTYTLRPCGHDISRFTATNDRVLEWILEGESR